MRKIIIIIFAITFLLAFLGAKTAAYILLGIIAVFAILITLIINRKRKPNAENTDDGEIIMLMDETHTDNVYASEEELMSNTKHNYYIVRSKGFND